MQGIDGYIADTMITCDMQAEGNAGRGWHDR